MQRTTHLLSFFAMGSIATSLLAPWQLKSPPQHDLVVQASELATAAVFGGRTPITALPFQIDQGGSYFVAKTLTGAPGQHGITIEADDVTLDLNGFSLVGVPGSLDGIHVGDDRENITILNGTVRDWGEDGIDGGAEPTRARLIQCFRIRAVDNGDPVAETGFGIGVGEHSLVRDCVAYGNGRTGINARSKSIVVHSRAAGGAVRAFDMGRETLLVGSMASESGAIGIRSLDGSSVVDCVAVDNASTGISSGTGCLVVGGNASGNGGFGIGSQGPLGANVQASISSANLASEYGFTGLLGNSL